MKLAVLMSTYNGKAYLQQQLRSILDQKCDFQVSIFVRDDGSTDGTKELLESYADEGLLQWYTGENLRPAKSFLHLLQNCPEHDFYAFADQDDFWEPEKLQSGVDLIKDLEGPAFSFANARLVDQQLQDLGRSVYRAAPATDFATISCAGGILGCTMIFNHSLAQLLRGVPAPGKLVMHDFYVAQVCAYVGGQICYDPTPQMRYRQHGNNVVGVSRSKTAAIKNRMKTLTKKAAVTVGEQAQSLLERYPDMGTPEDKKWLNKLAHGGFFSRLSVACSSKTRYSSKNQSLTFRLAILLGNR